MILPNDFLKTNFIPYYPAVYRKLNSGHVIYFYIADPATGTMKRRTIKINLIRKKFTSRRDFLDYIHKIIIRINRALDNYFFSSMQLPSSMERVVVTIEQKSELEVISLSDYIDQFLDIKSKDMRPDTMRSYRSFCKIYNSWCTDTGIKYLSDINKTNAAKFFDFLTTNRKVSNISYNNYIKLSRAFINFGIERNMVQDNPFIGIKKKRIESKKRELIPKEERERLFNCDDINPGFILVCMLIYNSLIRPKEIRLLRIKNICYDENCIIVPGDISKNHNTRKAMITPVIISMLKKMQLYKYSKNDYLFSCGFKPGKTPCGEKYYLKYFNEVREKLGWKNSYTLYSFRDTGITDLLKSGVPAIDVMKLADHSSLDVTSIYIKHIDNSLCDRLSKSAPEF